MPTKTNLNQGNSNSSGKSNNSGNSSGNSNKGAILEHSAVHKPVPGKGGKGK